MRSTSRALALTAAAAATLAFVSPAADASAAGPSASAHARSGSHGTDARHAVFVQTDEIAGNKIVAYRRNADGTLTYRHTYPTGGQGGALEGAVVDNLASQGAMTYDARHRILVSVNAGSDNISVFAVDGARLRLLQIVSSRGTFPVSVTTHGDRAYVLNARDGGSVQGFEIDGRRLHAVPGRHRALGLDVTTGLGEFTHTPGQVGFTPDGRELVVTTKAASHAIELFKVTRSGGLSATPVVTTKDGSVPFGFTFTKAGQLAVTEAGTSAVTTYAIRPDGALTEQSSVRTEQAATCWLVRAGRYLYASNAGSANLSGFSTGHAAGLELLGHTAADPGTVDAAVTPDQRFLYAQGGATGTVASFRVHHDGSLTALGSITVPNAVGAEGIVAL